MFRAKQPVSETQTDQQENLNLVYQEQDLTKPDYGMQRFVYKNINSVATIKVGSPVGETQASGGGVVTATQATAGAAGILGDGGGFAPVAVTASTSVFGWVQSAGITRMIIQTTGALAANDLAEWTGNDTIAVVGGTTEEFVFGRALVAAASGTVAAGGFRKFLS